MFKIKLWVITQLLRWVNSSKNRGLLAERRSEKVVAKFDELLLALHRAYHNGSCDMATNGEARVQSILSATNPAIVFDVGANRGDWAVAFHQLNSRPQIYAFEPIQETFALLKSNAPFTSAFPFALGAKNERVKFGKCVVLECSSKYVATIGDSWTYEEIEVRKGDDFIAEQKIPQIDFLKVDVEGMDYEVLQGFRKTIEAGQISVIQFEYTKYNIQSKDLLKDFYEFLSPYYTIGKIYPRYVGFREYHDDQEDFMQSNFLCVKKDLVDLHRKLATVDTV